MAEISLARIDSRLIHGQVLIMWTKIFPSKRILIIDDGIANDPFMFKIFKMAAPPNMKLEVLTAKQAAQKWQENRLGSVGPVFVLFKSVPAMYQAYQEGFAFDQLQLGGIGGGTGRIPVVAGNISLDEEDAKKLEELHQKGVSITLQVTPDTACYDWPSVKQKYFPSI